MHFSIKGLLPNHQPSGAAEARVLPKTRWGHDTTRDLFQLACFDLSIREENVVYL